MSLSQAQLDPHVHIYLPFMATFFQGHLREPQQGRASAGWHTTAHLDVLPLAQGRHTRLVLSFLWLRGPVHNRRVTFNPHCCYPVLRLQPSATSASEIVRARHQFVQIFLASKGRRFGIGRTRALYRTSSWPRLGCHPSCRPCENETLIAERQRELLAMGGQIPASHHESARHPLSWRCTDTGLHFAGTHPVAATSLSI